MKIGETAPRTVPGVEEFRVTADGLGDYVITVSRPGGEAATGPLPVLYLLDANLVFDLTYSLAKLLSMAGAMSPVMLVGIGYPPDEGDGKFYVRRNYDMTPREWNMSSDDVGRTVSSIARDVYEEKEIRSGGGARYLEFITGELHPVIAERYDTDGDRPSIIGDSSGGCFVLSCLLGERNPFSRYLCISPGALLSQGFVFEAADRWIAEGRVFDGRLFIACGEKEIDTHLYAICGIASGVTRIAESLLIASNGTADVTARIYPGADHMSVISKATQDGLMALFPVQTPSPMLEIAEHAAASK